MKKFILLLLIFASFSVGAQELEDSTFCARQKNPLALKDPIVGTFRVISIQRKPHSRVIYARCNGKKYKLLGELEYKEVRRILPGQKYKMTVRSVFPKYELPPGGGGATAFVFNGDIIKIEPIRNIWDLYRILSVESAH